MKRTFKKIHFDIELAKKNYKRGKERKNINARRKKSKNCMLE